MAVNKERVKLLVDALRSGEFTQGQNMLRTADDTYCCLGVACEVARRNGIGIEWELNPQGCEREDCQESHWKFNGSNEALGETVADWYGFEHDGHLVNDPQIGHDEFGNIVTMIRANDDNGWDFKRIADVVAEKYLNEEETA